ncbi:DUF418 domain-containing protein [Qipengyuania sphaerica]|uniref:DUF418 domain-containing protein n=1 Tax=Qipengyuania sphaerica TaxID=2867243 RepID=UPI001C880875|nr:DUF418 domain-containing protein [Qipengyuania sphaerica]MBX7541083.1 DUF418 domain-containing protein [Qipengyuania sphaerica]
MTDEQAAAHSSTTVAKAKSSRLEFVDALRGYALLGLLMVHSVDGFGTGTARAVPTVWSDVVYFLFESKAFTIFALLFGFGFATIMANQRARGVDFTKRFAWRLLLLLAVGTLHSLIYWGDILQVLALIGLLLIPIDKIRSNTVLLVIALACFLQLPLLAQWLAAEAGNALAARQPYFMGATFFETFKTGDFADVVMTNATAGQQFKWSVNWSFGRVSEIAGLFALGMVMQRTAFFARLSQEHRLALKVIVCGGLLIAALHFLAEPLIPTSFDGDKFPLGVFSASAFVNQWYSLAFVAIQISLLAMLWNSPARKLVEIFKLPGRMTLTLYVAHSVIAVPVLYSFGLGMWDDWSTRDMLFAGLVFYGAQIVFARWWYARYRYGPLEWTWRAATLTDWKVPMRVTPRAT